MHRRRASVDANTALGVRNITLINPATLAGDQTDTSSIIHRFQSKTVLKVVSVLTALCVAFALYKKHDNSHPELLLWIPLALALISLGLKSLQKIISARNAWREMQTLILGPHSLERLRRALTGWRADYKHGGARECTAIARLSISDIAMPLGLILILTHVLFYAVSHQSSASEIRLSIALACIACDVVCFSLLFYAGCISELMSSQSEFVTSARLRLCETSYHWADVAESESMKSSLKEMFLHQAIAMELSVIESYTRGQSFVVLGISMEPGRASQLVGASLAVMQLLWGEWSIVAMEMTLISSCIVGAFVATILPFAIVAMRAGV